MPVQLTKDSIDLGIVVSDAEKSLAFYREVLGFKDEGELPMPGGTVMHRLLCGTSMVKLLVHSRRTPAPAVPGGIPAGLGYRYFTMYISNLDEMVAACAAAGAPVIVPRTELRPGITIAIVEDPDGNWVEFVEGS